MEGVFGMARMTGTSSMADFSMASVRTEAAKEMSSLSEVSAGRISSISEGTWKGLTPISRMSA